MKKPPNIRRTIDVLSALARSDLRARYGRGRLRSVKWLLDPFALVGVYLLLVAFVLHRPGGAVGLSLACAIVPFQIVMMTVTNALRAVDIRAAIVGNMAFDRTLIPVACALVEALGFGACLVLVAILMAAYGVAPTPWILLLPVVLAVTLAFSIAVAFPAALLGVWMPELGPFATSFVRSLYFLAPGLVALSTIHGLTRTFIELNPLTGLFQSFRDVVLNGRAPAAWELLYPLGFSAVLLALVLPVWRREAPHFAKVLD
jgi:lipopolysaccharide transport system permease protein